MLPNKEEEKSWYKVKVGFKFYEISDNSYLEYRTIVYIQLYIVWFLWDPWPLRGRWEKQKKGILVELFLSYQAYSRTEMTWKFNDHIHMYKLYKLVNLENRQNENWTLYKYNK